MTRIDKIVRLVAVGFSATRLGESSNEDLEKTYIAAGPLMEAQDTEVAKVLSQEKTNSKRLKAEITGRVRDEHLQKRWNARWKPLPPICTVGADVDGYMTAIRGYKRVYEDNVALFRASGHRRFADAANKAKKSMQHLQGQLLHLSEKAGGAS